MPLFTTIDVAFVPCSFKGAGSPNMRSTQTVVAVVVGFVAAAFAANLIQFYQFCI